MIRALLVLFLIGLAATSSGAAADETFTAAYTPEGQVIAGQELIVSQNIFVGERFWSGYTLEFDTDLTDLVWGDRSGDREPDNADLEVSLCACDYQWVHHIHRQP